MVVGGGSTSDQLLIMPVIQRVPVGYDAEAGQSVPKVFDDSRKPVSIDDCGPSESGRASRLRQFSLANVQRKSTAPMDGRLELSRNRTHGAELAAVAEVAAS